MPPAKGILVAIELVTVVEKLASSPKAAASSLSVFNVPGAESTRFDMAVDTNAVVATLVVLFPADWVVAVTPLVNTPELEVKPPNSVFLAAISTPSTVPPTIILFAICKLPPLSTSR